MHSTILKRVALLMEKWRSARLSFSSLLLAGFACATILSVASFAQSDPPLNFGNNYFVTGDYVVAGAYFMNVNVANGYATGTITIPDVNPGITGAKFVPAGAEVVAAVLYWQTVEKTGTIPGQPGSGQNGFFRPVFIGGPKTGYPITGVNLGSDNTVTWSSGGCTAPSTGNNTRTYRANVLGALPRDASGNISANGIYEVRLPSTGNSTPLTLGASLVLIYRILSPSVPLNSIVIYDGAFGQNSASLTMTQTVQGFYDAAHKPVSRLTHIVGAGKSNKFQTVYLNSTLLPSLYGSSESAFPGWYGTWDNPTWTFDPNETYVKVPNPVQEDNSFATTRVVPSTSNEGCVSWGAVIVSTTVKNDDGDTLLNAWKKATPPGYCDAAVNQGVCNPGDPSWVDLPGAVLGHKDVFVQLDYMCSSVTGPDSCTTGDGVNYSFDPRPSGAVGIVTNMFAAQNVYVHVNPGTNQPDVHAIQETTCTDNLTSPPALCAFPVQPGVVAWKGGFDFFKNQLVDPTGAVNDCAVSSPPADCIPRFQPGKRYSWHYVLFAHAVGQPKWRLQDGTLRSVAQSGNAVTFTTSTPIGTLDMLTYQGITTADPYCPTGRVTIVGAATSPNLDGTYCVNSSFNPAGTSFTITVGGSSTTASYTFLTDPNLAVAVGQVNTTSGRSDVGGGDSLITLGLWGNPASPTSDGQKEPVIAGTLAHEFGHANGLTHGGFLLNSQSNQNYTPTILPNCAPNHQSVMSYSFQVDLLNNGSGTNVPDYSGQKLNTLNKSSSVTSNPFTTTPTYLSTSWYVPWSGVGTPATLHCDGTPITNAALMSRMTGPTASLSWSAGQDINFDGNTNESLPGFNDWANIDFRQIGATGSNSVLNGAGGQFNGGGGQFNGGGGQFNGGGGQFNGGGGQFNGGGGQFNGGGGQFNGGGEIDVATVNSITRSPQGLTVSEGVSPRTITLNWTAPTFGQIGEYKVYRSAAGGAFAVVATVTGAPLVTTYTDTVNCNPGGYSYFVTAVLAGTTQESVGSNTVSTSSGEPLTGCYTNTAKGSVALTNLAFTDLSSQNTPVQGDNIQITWSLNTDDTGVSVTRPAASTALVAIGPIPSDASCSSLAKPPEFLGYSGTYPYPVTTLSTSGSGITGNPFAFTWNTTSSNAGCYFFELDLDSHQYEQSTALTLLIFESDTTPHILSQTLPTATAGIPYIPNTIQESGGTGNLTWSITAGAVPPGMMFNTATGTVSGTPTTAGNYNFTVKVTDSVGNFGTRAFTLKVLIFLSDSAPPTINTTLPPATAGIAYSNTIQTTGGTGTLTWSITAGALPPGLSLGLNSGTVSGTPTTAGNYSFTVSVTDSALPANVASQAFTSKVLIFLSDSAPPTINTTLPPATAGITYSNTIQTTGGTAPLTWSITSGALPPGLSLSPLGVVSGTPTTAGNYSFTVQVADSASPANVASQAFTSTVLIFESDSGAPTVTPNLPAGTVGSPYSNAIDQVGGTAPLAWSVTAGALPPGLSLGSNSGTVSGTPTAPGNYNFTVQITDSASPPNVATLAFMLSVADAQYGDLIVVDGAPTASPAGTLFRITPTGTSGTIAAISNGLPTGVAVDPNTGNIYVAVDQVSGSGTTRIVKIGPSGTVTDPFVPGLPAEGAVLQNPVAVAVDASGNVYVGDNSTNAIYEFNSSGTQVGAGPFASLPSSSSTPNHIRMAFDSLGNLDVASDDIGGVPGQVEVDQVPPGGGTPTVLYNTTTKSTATYTLTAASAVDVNGNTTYTGAIPPTLCVGSSVTIAGFATTANNGTFIVQSCTTSTLVVNNPSGTMDTSGGTATLQLTAIGTVGGIAAFSDGSIDVADYGAQAIYKITNPGTTNMAITADISATSALCCNMSGMANPPGTPTPLFVTLTGANSTTPQLQQAVPPTSTVTTVNSTYALTAASVASGGNTTYTGTFSPTTPVGSLVTITGFTNATNNGTFTVVSCSSTQLVVNNGSGIAESNPGIAVTAPLTFPNDVAWYDYPPPG